MLNSLFCASFGELLSPSPFGLGVRGLSLSSVPIFWSLSTSVISALLLNQLLQPVFPSGKSGCWFNCLRWDSIAQVAVHHPFNFCLQYFSEGLLFLIFHMSSLCLGIGLHHQVDHYQLYYFIHSSAVWGPGFQQMSGSFPNSDTCFIFFSFQFSILSLRDACCTQ